MKGLLQSKIILTKFSSQTLNQPYKDVISEKHGKIQRDMINRLNEAIHSDTQE